MSITEEIDGTASGPDAELGKLFDVPRVGIVIDDADPTVVKVAFSGSVELDRGNAKQMEFYNRMRHGKPNEVIVTVHVAGSRKIHRRDGEGDVDAIVETKGLVVTDVYLAPPGES